METFFWNRPPFRQQIPYALPHSFDVADSTILPPPQERLTHQWEVSMYWWMVDGPYLVRMEVHPDSHAQLLKAYNPSQRTFDFYRGEWDIFGGWDRFDALLTQRIRYYWVARPEFPPNLIDPFGYNPSAHQQMFNQEPIPADDNDPDMDIEIGDTNDRATNFGIPQSDFERLQHEYVQALAVMTDVVFKPLCDDLHMMFMKWPTSILEWRYGFKGPTENADAFQIAIHWKNADGSNLTPFDQAALNRFTGSTATDN
jgi:hypothetical protein